MGFRIPRITLQVNYEEESSFGELGLLSLGFGIHQAWIFATQFGTASIFGDHTIVVGSNGASVTLPFFVSSIALVLSLFFMAITNQKFLKAFVSRPMLVGSSLCMVLGTALLIPSFTFGSYGWETVSGILTGIGSAVILTFWGTAFARCDASTIIINTAVAVTISVTIYAFGLTWLPQPFGGIVAAALPLAELAILWVKTPLPFTRRSEIPIFEPLPLNRGKFALRLGLPVFAFGLALGALRRTSVQEIVPAATPQEQVFMLLAACCATVVIMITIMATGNSDRWQRFFRPLVPFIAVTLILLPLSYAGAGSMLIGFALLMGYLCFEALLWSFFAMLSERFRISPIFVFGIGRGFLALAILIGTSVPLLATQYSEISPINNDAITMIMLVIMVVAYALLPREHEIESLVLPCPAIGSMRTVASSSADSTQALSAQALPAQDVYETERIPERAAEATAGSTAEATVEDWDTEVSAPPATVANTNEISPSTDTFESAHAFTAATGASAPAPAPAPAPHHPHTDFVHRAQHMAAQHHVVTNPTALNERGDSKPDQQMSDARRAMLAGTSEQETIRRSAPFRAKCETVANTYLLSVRETEVLYLLAKGLNSASIQEKLYISEGTAKTHIRHIYRKLDIHSQQELMRIVESASYEH